MAKKKADAPAITRDTGDLATKHSERNEMGRFVPSKYLTEITKVINSIERRQGVVRAEDLVDAARPLTSPIHDYFDWDDESAAVKYRITQARNFISAIRVEIEDKNLPAFVSVKVQINGEDSKGYVPMTRVLSDEGLRNELLRRGRQELNYWAQKYKDIEELIELIDIKKLTGDAT